MSELVSKLAQWVSFAMLTRWLLREGRDEGSGTQGVYIGAGFPPPPAYAPER